MSTPRVTVIGLGYVGMTLSVALALRGVDVFGVERRADIVEGAKLGRPAFEEPGLAAALQGVIASGKFAAATDIAAAPASDYYIITVGTPLSLGTTEPRLDMIDGAAVAVAAHMRGGETVILRSTVKVGTTRSLVKPILDRSGKSYRLAMCPERALQGVALHELAELPQIIGGIDEASTDDAAALFARLTETIVRVRDPETAEMIKLVDNTWRDVRFAFANEIARASDALGISGIDVIRYGKLGYPRTNLANPGLVGGPCLEKDPHILASSVAELGMDLEITRAARVVNERQPRETIASVLALGKARLGRPPSVIVVAGIAFKGVPEADDLRGAMSLRVIDELRAKVPDLELRLFDPVIGRNTLAKRSPGAVIYGDLMDAIAGADCLIITNNHPALGRLPIEGVRRALVHDGFVYDYWGHYASGEASALRDFYFSVGNLAGVYA